MYRHPGDHNEERDFELPVQELMRRARPMPPPQETGIEDLSEDEGAAFLAAFKSWAWPGRGGRWRDHHRSASAHFRRSSLWRDLPIVGEARILRPNDKIERAEVGTQQARTGRRLPRTRARPKLHSADCEAYVPVWYLRPRPGSSAAAQTEREVPYSLRIRVMELAGLEPATSWVRSRRSPN
jgi:hypothetical protein